MLWSIFAQNVDAMSDIEKIQLFENKKIRTAWDEGKQEWFFSIVDVCGVLTDQPTKERARNYWKVLKSRMIKEGSELVTKCNRLKLVAEDGKQRATDVADMTLMFRIIESIPSKKAEPIKVWMAQVAAERINQAIDPERSIDQAIADYRRLGYSEAWINQRIKTIEIRKGLTDEWKRGGVTKEVDFAFLTDLMSKTWSGMTTREYKRYKGLTKENLRDNMTNMELLLNALAEETATEISKQNTPLSAFGLRGLPESGLTINSLELRSVTSTPSFLAVFAGADVGRDFRANTRTSRPLRGPVF